jgi:TatA/E family protein of Tat protein translocase
MFNFLNNIGPTEIIIGVLVIIIFIGSKKMTELAKTAGESTKELKKAKDAIYEDVDNAKKEILETAEGKTDNKKKESTDSATS